MTAYLVHDRASDGCACARCPVCGQLVALAANGDGVLRLSTHHFPECAAPNPDRFTSADVCGGSERPIGKLYHD